jgi:hypothetical protein
MLRPLLRLRGVSNKCNTPTQSAVILNARHGGHEGSQSKELGIQRAKYGNLSAVILRGHLVGSAQDDNALGANIVARSFGGPARPAGGHPPRQTLPLRKAKHRGSLLDDNRWHKKPPSRRARQSAAAESSSRAAATPAINAASLARILPRPARLFAARTWTTNPLSCRRRRGVAASHSTIPPRSTICGRAARSALCPATASAACIATPLTA